MVAYSDSPANKDFTLVPSQLYIVALSDLSEQEIFGLEQRTAQARAETPKGGLTDSQSQRSVTDHHILPSTITTQ